MAQVIGNPSVNAYDVVILGAGYAGLMAALRLAGKGRALRVALVSESEHFFERVRLQECIDHPPATRLPALADLVAGTNISFITGRVVGLDAATRIVRVNRCGGTRELGFAHAIYALGSRVEQDSVPGIAEHAYRLDRGDDPRGVAALRAELRKKAGRRLSVVIVGGANTATEVAGEIKTAWPAVEVTMVSRSRCGDFNKGERVTHLTRLALERLGIRLIDGETVTEVGADAVRTASGKAIPADICVWAGGLRASPIGAAAGLATDRQARILVGPTLRSTSHPSIIAVGDAAHPLAPTGAGFRLSAFAALVSGAYAADSIAAETAGRPLRPFSFSTFGQGVAIGRGGVGFTTYPDDRRGYFLLTGRVAFAVRNFFVWFLLFVLKMERRFPGSFFWLGRRRVSWREAEAAMRKDGQRPALSPVPAAP
jgi:NADH:ubiquinone reductase (H+-translocating)